MPPKKTEKNSSGRSGDVQKQEPEKVVSKSKPKKEAKRPVKPNKRSKMDVQEQEPEKVVSKSKKEVKRPARPNKRAKMDKSESEAESESDEEVNDDSADFEKPSTTKTGVKRKAPAKKAAGKENLSKKTDTKVALKNATNTKWETIDFSCTKKTSEGKESNFHIISWNVDGLRAWLKKGGLDILQHDQPDILCLQEVKVSEAKIPEEIKVEGYEVLWKGSEKEGYAGVAILSKIKPLSVSYGIGDEAQDVDGRCIAAEYEKFYLVNVYVPNAGRKLVTLPKRLDWNRIFKKFIQNLSESKPVIICGDMNVAHAEIDLTNPKTNTKNAGFTPQEREGMTEFLKDGYVDTYRHFYPDKTNAYTFWSYMTNARAKNIGWRLDYFIVSDKFMKNICDTIIFSDVLGSDHCPLGLFLNLE